MKRLILSFVLVLLMLSLVACGGETPEGPEIPGDTPGDTPETPDLPACEHEFVEISRTEAMPLKDGVTVSKCSLCDEEKTDVHTPMTKKLKVLAIGNSHSENAVHDLWDVCNSAGMSNVIVGNAVIGGSGLADHGSAMLFDSPAYTYKKYTGVSKKDVSEENVKISRALTDEKWDVVVIQQRSQYVKDATFDLLPKVIEVIQNKCPTAKIYWHITWAFENIENFSSASIKNDFIQNFGGDSTVMYEAIIDSLKRNVLPNENIEVVIPAATALQNLRTSYVGETLTRDGVHTNPGMARYTVALTWYSFLTGGSLDSVKWYPSSGEQKTEILSNYDAIREAVENAIETPYAVTASKYTVAPWS